MNETMTPTCGWCGNRLQGDEAADPRIVNKHVICGECHREHYEFTCCWCGEYEETEYQDEVLVVFERQARGRETIRPGLYRIVRRPYWVDGMIDCWVLRNSLKPIARRLPPSLAQRAEEHCYPCGHLCRACQERVGVKTGSKEPSP